MKYKIIISYSIGGKIYRAGEVYNADKINAAHLARLKKRFAVQEVKPEPSEIQKTKK